MIDFGSATFDDEAKGGIINTRQYRAPEVILDLGWSLPSDIWGLGCILMELYTGQLLFKTHDSLEHLALIQASLGPFPPSMVRPGKYFDSKGHLRYPAGASSESQRHVRKQLPLANLIHKRDTVFLDLVRRMLEVDPAKRITAAEALNHPLFTSVRKEKVVPVPLPPPPSQSKHRSPFTKRRSWSARNEAYRSVSRDGVGAEGPPALSDAAAAAPPLDTPTKPAASGGGGADDGGNAAAPCSHGGATPGLARACSAGEAAAAPSSRLAPLHETHHSHLDSTSQLTPARSTERHPAAVLSAAAAAASASALFGEGARASEREESPAVVVDGEAALPDTGPQAEPSKGVVMAGEQEQARAPPAPASDPAPPAAASVASSASPTITPAPASLDLIASHFTSVDESDGEGDL